MKKILTILTTLASTITIENCISNFNLRTITLQNDCFKKNNVHQSNNDFIFSDLYKNNKGEIYSITNDGIYKYTNDKNTFIKIKGINGLIISLKFDAKDNIYALKTNGIYKCLVNKNEFKKMKVTTNTNNYSFTNIKIDSSNNVYVWSKKDGVYKCLVNKNEFKKIGGIYLSQADNFRIYLLFSKNNVYALTTEYNDYHNKIIYKLLANENEFTLIDGRINITDRFSNFKQ
ncbi:hypothetical protein [Spiroplasma endosymbiont of Thecophora atra]|uniref:hypothetical protein n=1 Tax=Spiroplasma endosymbiont of Thecophora atra TaxID=3066294 RepID=UPI0030D5BE5B